MHTLNNESSHRVGMGKIELHQQICCETESGGLKS